MTHSNRDSLSNQLRNEQARRLGHRVEITQALLSSVQFLADPVSFADLKINLIAAQAYAALTGGQILVVVCLEQTGFENILIYSEMCQVESETLPALVVGSDFRTRFETNRVNTLHQVYQMLGHVLGILKGLDPGRHEDTRSIARESGRFYRAYFATHPAQTPTVIDREIMNY